MSKLTKEIATGEDLSRRVSNGVGAAYEVAKAAYGPGAGNVIIELPYGDPIISRDGVTNLERLYLEDPVENAAARLIVQASKKNNRKVGDGTTAVAILANHLYTEARKLVAAGHNRMEVYRLLKAAAKDVIEQIDNMKVSVDDKLLKHVAVVSAGDEAIGHMIADVISEVGLDGGVSVEDFAGVGIYNELVDGFYFRKGFTNVNLINDPTNLESRHQNVDILISEKRIATATDIVPLLDKIVGASGKGREMVLIGDVSDEALGVLVLNRLKGIINVVVADLPVYGPMRSLTMEDLALVTGGKVYTQGANPSDFDLSMLGGAEKVIINEFSTTIIGGEAASEDVEKRVAELRQQLKDADSPVTTDALKDRISRLTGKVAIIRVGGATEVEQSEVKLRVEDAICAVQAAIKDGIVPGGGVTLARVETLNFSEAYKKLFCDLADNAGLNSQALLGELLSKKDNIWLGYNFRNYQGLCDLLKEGVVDPASVVKETVQNASSVVAELITGNLFIGLADRAEKHD